MVEGRRGRAPEMRNRDPKEVAEIKAQLAQQRELARLEKLTPQELMAEQRAAERQQEGLTTLDASDLEEIPESPAVEQPRAEKAGVRLVQHAGSESGPIVAQVEHKATDPAVMRERRLRDAEKQIKAFLDAGKDPEVLRARLEAQLESAEESLADLGDDQDTMRAEQQMKIDTASAQLRELDRIEAGGGVEDSQEIA